MNDDLIVLHRGKEYRIPQYSLENSSSSFQMFFYDAFSNTFVMPNNIGEPAVTAFVRCMQQNESTIEEKIGEYDISKLSDLLLLSEALAIDDLEQWCLRAIKPISDAVTDHLTKLGGSDHLADLSDHAIERFLAAEIITEFEVTSLASLPWSSLAPSINLILDKLGKYNSNFIIPCVKAHGIAVLYHEDVMKRVRLDNSKLTTLEMFIPSCERTSEVRHHFDIWRERNEFGRGLCDVIMKNKNSIGYFYAGRSLYQKGNTDRLKELGLKMIQESAKAGILDAKLFLVTWNITKRDFRNARNEILKLISNGMNVDDLVSLLDKYPEIRLCEEKEWFDNYLRGGYLRSRTSDPEKAALVNFYINHVSDDVSVIAETLPDDSTFLYMIPLFFAKLNGLVDNCHVKYFIALDCICGIHRVRDVRKGLAILQNIVCDRTPVKNASPYNESRRSLPRKYDNFNIVFLGSTARSREKLIDRLYEEMEQGRYVRTTGSYVRIAEYHISDFMRENEVVWLDLWNTACLEKHKPVNRMFIRHADCAVLLYDSTNSNALSELINLYDSTMDSNSNIRICVVQELTEVEPNEDVVHEVMKWSMEQEFPHISIGNDRAYTILLNTIAKESMIYVSWQTEGDVIDTWIKENYPISFRKFHFM